MKQNNYKNKRIADRCYNLFFIFKSSFKNIVFKNKLKQSRPIFNRTSDLNCFANTRKYRILTYFIKIAKFRNILFSYFLLIANTVNADNAAITQTKSKLNELETKISSLKQELIKAKDKTSLLNNELSTVEKKISANIMQIRINEKKVESKQSIIKELTFKIDELNDKLTTQQQLLASHVRTRYILGEYQPLKWLINQDDPYKASHLLTLYQYILQSRKNLIDKIQETKTNLAINQNKLHLEVKDMQILTADIKQQQQKFEQDKIYSKEIINSINEDILNKEQGLNEYLKNKNNLTQILANILKHSIENKNKPIILMRSKLPQPVVDNNHKTLKLNQGIVFFANEGSPVNAVYQGKVVFSDWLNGYGLLLIVDHGHGFMTLYAHNQSLFKQKGETVFQGEQIATVGHSGGIKKNGLYFEIRQSGKAIPPLKWLS